MFTNAVDAGQSESIKHLFDRYNADIGVAEKRILAQNIAQKIYEEKVAGYPIEKEIVFDIAKLLESNDDQITYSGATAVVYLGEMAQPIGNNVLNLYSRIVEGYHRNCKKDGINDLSSPEVCNDVGLVPSDLQFRVCSALAALKYISSDKDSYAKCVNMSP